MPTVLITGANRGLGLEYARQYAEADWQVIGTVRDPSKADVLRALSDKIEVQALDVGDRASIEALAKSLAGRPITHLVSNAGIYGGDHQALGDMDYVQWAAALLTNTIGPFQLVEALLPNLQKAKAQGEMPKIALMSSLMGSIADASSGSVIYRTSKAALNMAGQLLAQDLKGQGIIVLLLHPGWVATDMGGQNAPLQPPESIRGLRAVIDAAALKDSGSFVDYRGKTLPW